LFHGRIDVFDGAFAPVAITLTDPQLPAGFAPFNVRVLGGRIFVVYGVPNATKDDIVPGPGNGIIDTFNLDGTLESRLVTRGALNAPWGIAPAPANFGALSNTLLVANFGDGRVNSFSAST